jgi:hypothetical protein
MVIVPTRGRPDNLSRVIAAWDRTDAWRHAQLVVARDADDPSAPAYAAMVRFRSLVEIVFPTWLPMVHKLDRVAVLVANGGEWSPFAVGFAGDDHLPRTEGWARRYVEALRELGSGIVYGDDLLQRAQLPTQWAMTADIVRRLGRMVPAPVEHLYCDDAILALGRAAGCIRYLPDVVVEHMHPVAGKAPADWSYGRSNSRRQYERDGAAYRQWRDNQLAGDVAKLKAVTVGG